MKEEFYFYILYLNTLIGLEMKMIRIFPVRKEGWKVFLNGIKRFSQINMFNQKF